MAKARVSFMVPVQFFQSVIAVELAIVGALLWQIRFFEKEDNQEETSGTDPRLKLLLLVVLTAILFGSLGRAPRRWWPAGRGPAHRGSRSFAIADLVACAAPRSTRRNHATANPQLWVTLLGLVLFAAVVVLLILIG